MNVLRSILLLFALCVVIGFPYFFGHGLATHSPAWMAAGFACLLFAAGLFWFIVKRVRPLDE